MANAKVAVIGAGNVGASTALRLAQLNIADIVMTDIVEGMPQGKALDMMESAPLLGIDVSITGTNDYKDIAGSDIVAITAGVPRKPGMSRDDLLKINARIIGEVVDNVVKHAPESIIVMISNPLDVMTYLAYNKTGFDKKRVMGMAGVLDSVRLRCFIAMELGVSVKEVSAMVLGGHGDSMVPLPDYSTVSGIPIVKLLPKDAIDRMIARTQKAGGEIVALLKTGSAYYAPAAAAAAMVESILLDQKQLLPCCTKLEGEYGLSDVFVGVPVVLGKEGVEKVVELPLSPEDSEKLKSSADHVKSTIEQLKECSD
ncbi:malate dehydrogenase [bacterium]|nr:malate dehydrogenase [bacterium]